MKNTANLIRLVVIFSLIFAPAVPHAQESPDKIADSFYEHGLKLLESGDYNAAINDFSRAFLLNPQDPKLYQALKSLARDRNVPAAQKMELILLEDLLGYTNKLQEKRDYFRYKRNVLGEELINKGFDRSFFEEEMMAMQQGVFEDYSVEEQAIQERYAKGEDPVKVIHASIQLENERLQKEIDLYERQFGHLREINAQNGYIEGELVYLSPSEFSRKQKFYDADGKRLPVDVAPVQIAAQDLNSIDGISYLLDEAKTQIDNMKMVVDGRDDKIQQLSQEVVDLSLELTESRANESFKDQEITELKDVIVEFETKSLLSQRMEQNFSKLKSDLAKRDEMIQEKDQKISDMGYEIEDKDRNIEELSQQIQELVSKSDSLQKDLEERDLQISNYEAQIQELEASAAKLQEYQDEVWKLRHELTKAREGQGELTEVRSQLAQTEQELAMKDELLAQKDQTVNDLNQQLADLEIKFAQSQQIIAEKEALLESQSVELAGSRDMFDSQLMAKDGEIQELNKILEEYRDKLANVDKMLNEKDASMASLQEELTGIRGKLIKDEENRFVISEADVAKKDEMIAEKEAELAELSQMVSVYKSNLAKANKDINYQKQQIDELTKELANLDNKMMSRDRLSREKLNHIKLLKDMLKREKEKRDERNQKLREIVKEKVLEIEELEGMLDVYKSKLKDRHFVAEEREQLMANMENQLQSTLMMLNSKSDVINKTHHNLSVLQDQLNEINDSLIAIQNGSSGSDQADVDEEINRLQLKIDDINTFLQGEIQTIESDKHMSDADESSELDVVDDIQLDSELDSVNIDAQDLELDLDHI